MPARSGVFDGFHPDGPALSTVPNLVQPVRRIDDGLRAVVKRHGDRAEYKAELAALQHYQRYVADPRVRVVRLLDHDDDDRALLLEHVAGRRLDDGWPRRGSGPVAPEGHSIAALVGIMAALSTTPRPGAGAPGWRDPRTHLQALERPAPPGIDAHTLGYARNLAETLSAETLSTENLPTETLPTKTLPTKILSVGAAPRVLHGDLHHANVIEEDDGTCVVLDPKGVIGHPGFELGPVLANPLGRLAEAGAIADVLAARVDTIGTILDAERSRVAGWGFVSVFVGAVWRAEDGLPPAAHLAVADALQEIARTHRHAGT